jgi:agmatine deiminase
MYDVELQHTITDAEPILRNLMPHEPYDYTGHADGIVRFPDESRVLVNDYKGTNSTFSASLIKTLHANKLNPVAFPYHPSEKRNKEGDYTAIGNNMNFLWVGNTIGLPEFRLKNEAQHL